jgi:hypothetical protein
MTSPCLNCHQSIPTAVQPKSDCESSSNSDPKMECRAHDSWLPWLSEDPLDPQQRNSLAVSNNFELTRLLKAYANPPAPYAARLLVKSADVDVKIRPHSESFLPLPWSKSPYHAIDLNVSSSASVDGHLEIRDNQLAVQGRSLLEVHGIHIDGPLFFNIEPKSFTIGPDRQLYFILQPSAGLTALLDSSYSFDPELSRRVGKYDPIQGKESFDPNCYYFEKLFPYCPNSETSPERAINFSEVIRKWHISTPAELEINNGFSPAAYNLQDLLQHILDKFRAPQPATPPKKGRLDLTWLLSHLDGGSEIQFTLQDLQDLFLPGLIDLGPSSAQLGLRVNSDHSLALDVYDFNLHLDAMDYPATQEGISTNTSRVQERPFIQLRGGDILPGAPSILATGELIEPGIHAVLSPLQDHLEVKANIQINFQAELPLLGPVAFSGQLIFKTRFDQGNDGWRVAPKSTLLEMQNLELLSLDKKQPLLSQASLFLSDDPTQLSLLEPLPTLPLNLTPFHWNLQGVLGEDTELRVSGFVPVMQNPDGSYDFPRTLQNAALEMMIQLKDPKSGTVLQGGEVNIRRAQHDCTDQWKVELQAEQLKIPTLKITGLPPGITLRDLSGKLEISWVTLSKEDFSISLPLFSLEANPKGSPSGLARGKISIKQDSKTPLVLMWNQQHRKLDINNLDLAVNAQRLYFITEKFARILDPSVASLGLDGHIAGQFTINFPKKREEWNGSGKVGIHGGREGDVSFLDAKGQRVGPPLLTNTRWEFLRVSRINWDRRYALGDFGLSIEPNISALSLNSPEALPKAKANKYSSYFGGTGQKLDPTHQNAIMTYHNQPWGPAGFLNYMFDYVIGLCQENESCREQAQKRVVTKPDLTSEPETGETP